MQIYKQKRDVQYFKNDSVIRRKKLSIPQADMSFRCSSAFFAAILQASSSVLAIPNTTVSGLVDIDRRIIFLSGESRKLDGHTIKKPC
jgi:hypothetical protein